MHGLSSSQPVRTQAPAQHCWSEAHALSSTQLSPSQRAIWQGPATHVAGEHPSYWQPKPTMHVPLVPAVHRPSVGACSHTRAAQLSVVHSIPSSHSPSLVQSTIVASIGTAASPGPASMDSTMHGPVGALPVHSPGSRSTDVHSPQTHVWEVGQATPVQVRARNMRRTSERPDSSVTTASCDATSTPPRRPTARIVTGPSASPAGTTVSVIGSWAGAPMLCIVVRVVPEGPVTSTTISSISVGTS